MIQIHKKTVLQSYYQEELLDGRSAPSGERESTTTSHIAIRNDL